MTTPIYAKETLIKFKLQAATESGHGLRKRDLFSPADQVGHMAFDRLAALGLIRTEFHSDPANMNSYYVYYWVGK